MFHFAECLEQGFKTPMTDKEVPERFLMEKLNHMGEEVLRQKIDVTDASYNI